MGLDRETREHGIDETPAVHGEARAPAHADGPGTALVRELIQRGRPSPREVASIIEAHPTEQPAIVQLLQRTLGNHFTAEVFRATAPTDALAEPAGTPPPTVDAKGPLGPAIDVDPAQVAADEIGRGAHDENKITNEVFWKRHPSLRAIELTAGTPAADEWLRLRDLYVRPALARKPAPAPPTLEGGTAGPELVKTVADHADAQPTAKDGVADTVNAKSSDPGVAALLAWEPTGVGGEKGQAAWLLAAIGTKLIGAFPQTKAQLQRLADGHATVMSTEQDPDEVRSPAKNVKRVGSSKGGYGVYSIAMADTPILGVLCTLARSRIQQWIDEGSPKVKMLFQLGTMARGDMGFSFHSRHAQGSAIDINFGDWKANKKAFASEKDVIDLLDGLEPGQIGSVFPDNDDHIHLAVNGGKYELGLPFQGPFFPKEKSLAVAKKAAEKKHPNPKVGDTIEATGMDVYTTSLSNKAVAKYGEWKGVTKWWWGPTKDGGGGGARDKLKSQKLKDLLDKLGAGGDGPVPTAKAEDGHTDNTEEPDPKAPTAPDRATRAKGVDAKPDHEMKPGADTHDEHDPEKCKGDCGHDHG